MNNITLENKTKKEVYNRGGGGGGGVLIGGIWGVYSSIG